MNLQAFFNRINYNGDTTPNFETLSQLQQAFLLAVPFENLNIHMGRKITIDLEQFYAKIVGERRGGFCYECNTLFGAVLTELGYQVEHLSARMKSRTTGNFGDEFDHMVLRVTLDKPYLVDVGNGQACRTPLAINVAENNDHTPPNAEGFRYKIGPADDGDLALYYQGPNDNDWKKRFLFTQIVYQPNDFADKCHYQQTSPDSPFTKQRFLTIATKTGRVHLAGNTLTIIENGQRTERQVSSDADYDACLKQYFGVDLSIQPT
ncbi:MAG: arylamine N-acetyltransferase [Chloroflexota bacterium]